MSKLVKYEQRLKTNRIKFLDKMHKKWNIATIKKIDKSKIIFFESIYEELTKKTKLKIKRNGR